MSLVRFGIPESLQVDNLPTTPLFGQTRGTFIRKNCVCSRHDCAKRIAGYSGPFCRKRRWKPFGRLVRRSSRKRLVTSWHVNRANFARKYSNFDSPMQSVSCGWLPRSAHFFLMTVVFLACWLTMVLLDLSQQRALCTRRRSHRWSFGCLTGRIQAWISACIVRIYLEATSWERKSGRTRFGCWSFRLAEISNCFKSLRWAETTGCARRGLDSYIVIPTSRVLCVLLPRKKMHAFKHDLNSMIDICGRKEQKNSYSCLLTRTIWPPLQADFTLPFCYCLSCYPSYPMPSPITYAFFFFIIITQALSQQNWPRMELMFVHSISTCWLWLTDRKRTRKTNWPDVRVVLDCTHDIDIVHFAITSSLSRKKMISVHSIPPIAH